METIIESHLIAGHGTLLSFIDASSQYAVFAWDKDRHVNCLEQAAQCEDKESREFMMDLIRRLNAAHNDSAELRKRIETIGNAVKKINHNLKSA